MNISIGNDHAGPQYKKAIVNFLKERGYNITDYGTNRSSSVDYPDLIHPVAKNISLGKSSMGIIICGSGNGAAMTANKYKKIRAALCWNKETTRLARRHNDANILSLPARFISTKQAIEMVKIFIETEFEGGRHQARIEKIPCK